MLKVLLRLEKESFFRLIFSDRNGRRRRPAGSVALSVFVLYLAACFFIMFGSLFERICVPLERIRLEWLYFALAAFMAFAFGFIGNVFATQSKLFDASDNEFLMSMPIAPKFILAGRMLFLLLTNLFYTSLITVPAGAVYFRHHGATFPGLLIYIAGSCLLPLLVQTFSALAAWAISLLSSRMRKKNVISALLSFLFLGLYFYGYGKTEALIAGIIANGTEIAAAVRRLAFPVYCFGVAAADRSLTALLLYTATVLAPFELVYAVLAKNFFRIAAGGRGAAKIRYHEKAMKVRGPRRALIRKELARFWDNPMILMNAVMGLLILLILTVASVMKGDLAARIFPQGNPVSDARLPIVCLVLCGAGTTVLLAAPSVSLEGKSLWILKSSPVRGREILLAKAEAQMLVSIPAVAFAAAVFAARLSFDGRSVLTLLLVVSLFNAFYALLGVSVGLRHPQFDFRNEIVTVKQGTATLITMAAGTGILIGAGVLYPFVFMRWFSPDGYCLLWSGLLFLGVLVTRLYLSRRGEREWETVSG